MRIGLNMSLTGAGSVSPLALYALGGLTPFFVNDADGAKYLDDLTGNKNLHDVWDNASTREATCIDADGSLKWGLHNLFVNSAVGVTQTISVTSGADFTIRFKGTGSITYSGAASGTLAGTGADDIVRVEVTASTASLVCTVSGSITVVGVYRSDLGGMQLSSKDGEDYVETGASPKFALRVDHSNGVPEVLAEPLGTNGIRNSTMQGAAVGIPGSGGSLPNNFGAFGGTIATEVIAFGTIDGFPYIDIKVTGSPSSAGIINFDSKSAIAAAENEVWTNSFYAYIVDGTTTNVTTISPRINWRDGGTSSISADAGADFKDETTFAKRSLTATGVASTGYILPQILLNCSGPVDFTLRVSAPQCEQSHVATSFIPTTTAAATRAKDEPTRGLPDGFIQGEGSIYFEGSIDYETSGSGFPRIFQIDDGTGNNRVGLIPTESSNSVRFSVSDSGVGTGAGLRVVNSGEVFKSSARYATGDLALSVGGQGVESVAPASISTALTTLRIGDPSGVTDTVRIRDFRLFPYSSPSATPGWSDATLETISGA